MIKSQRELLAEFNKRKPGFNPEIFTKSEDDIIECLKKVILSCQRSRTFTIKVEGFEVIENYDEINKILFEYYEEKHNNYKQQDNVYNYINLKDSDIKLLIVHYYIGINEKKGWVDDRLTVVIAVPRIVERYYFRINGNFYAPMYQIVEGSTYNNSTSKAKRASVTLRSIFMPIRVLRDTTQYLTTVGKTAVECTHYSLMLFNKFAPVMKYILAKYGVYGTLELFHINYFSIIDEPLVDDESYTFMTKGSIYVKIPKYVYDNSSIVQSLCYTVVNAVNKFKAVTSDEIFTIEFWVKSLGSEFNNFSVEKGLSVLDSLEGVYDMITKEKLRLPEENKQDIYHILAWMIGEFNQLRLKDNLDLGMKRIRWAEYIAALYAMKLSVGIYRISDIGKKATIKTIIKSIKTTPNFLLRAIASCRFIRYRDLVNDMDSLLATRFTYKGLAGIGEKSDSVPDSMKFANTTQLGRLDIDSSSDQDPGVTGNLCPRVKLYNDGFFSDYMEPNTWNDEIIDLMNQYKKIAGLKDAIEFKKKVLGKEDSREESVNEATVLNDLVYPFTAPPKKDEDIPVGENGMLLYNEENN